MALETLNLSGIKAGDSLNISVSQGGLTAGPYSVGSWGGGGDGGPITVNAIHRSYRQIAPDSVRFEVDLSSSNFDTPGPTGSEVYDARLHDLIYLWDLDDPGTWDEPVNVLTAWKNRNVAKGPGVRHLYRTPGEYTASVLIVEPSSGKTATGSVTFDVGDPQDFYGDANTIYVNNVGDSDFSDVPAGVPEANKINIDSLRKVQATPAFIADATWSNFEGGSAKRWRFKRGGSWEVSVYLDSDDTPDIMFDDYGDPLDPKPIWNVFTDPETSELACLRMGYNHDDQGISGRSPTANPPDLRISNIDFRGRFDATSTWATDPAEERASAMNILSAHDIAVVDCKFSGFAACTIYIQAGIASYDRLGKLHMDNCSIEDFGGEYQVVHSNTATEQSSCTFTGVRWENPGDAVSSGSGYVGSRSPARITSPRFIHMRGCDSFMCEEDLGHFQILKGAQDDGYLVNVHSCSAEHGANYVGTDGSFQNTPQDRSHVHNMIFDGIVYVGGHKAQTAFEIWSTGVTVRNVLYVVPKVDRIGNSANGIIQVSEKNDTGSPFPAFVADAPIRVYSSTAIVLREATQNAPSGLYEVNAISEQGNAPNFSDVSEANNLIHAPNWPTTASPNASFTPYAPVSTTTLWTPRYLGRRDPATLVLDDTYKIPVDSVRETRPLTGSDALGAALTGDVSYMDIELDNRPEPPSIGAWEAA